jgi:NitT/TauT family transport system ATP-binding protein
MNNFELQHITKQFKTPDGTDLILQDVNLVVEPGEFLCLMGPSGCGKSTLLRIMADLIPASAGEVLHRPQKLGFVFQSFGLMPWLTVSENIAYGLKMQGASHAHIASKVHELIEHLGLHGLADSHPKELSGGQKQRVGIARALAVEPDILMLDEPFSALDAFTADELRQDLLKIWEKSSTTFVMVTHLPAEAATLADRIVVLSTRPGMVMKTIDNQLPRPRNQRTPDFYKLVDKLERLIRPQD